MSQTAVITSFDFCSEEQLLRSKNLATFTSSSVDEHFGTRLQFTLPQSN